MRILAKDIVNHLDQKISVAGWLHKKRLLGGLTFINLRDRSGIIQVLLENKDEVEKLRGLQIGTVLAIDGQVFKDDRAPGGAELHNAKLTVMVPILESPPIEIDKPISHKPEHLDSLFDLRVIGLRNLQEQTIFMIRAALVQYLRAFLIKNDFIEVQTPKLLAEATEGGAEVFKLDYFGREATLAQSPQLYKQMLVGVFERVFEIGPAFRAEPSATTRHVSEVTMLDVELGFINGLDDVLEVVQNMTYDVIQRIYQEHAAELKQLQAPPLVLTPQFPRYTVKQVHEMYNQATGQTMSLATDLTPEEERWICEYATQNNGCEAVFVTHFPVNLMKFYHQINPDDTTTVLWGDLLFRGIELATCPVREHDLNKLIAQMKQAGLDPEHPGYQYYLQAFKYGLPPHGGCGFGVDRLVEKVIGLNNVKEAILFPRDINRLTP